MISLCLLAGSSVAQKGFYLGAGGTMMSTWMTNVNNYGLPDMDYVSTFGGGFNLNVGYDFTKNIGLKLEIGYSKLGQKLKDNRNDTTYTRNIKMNYLMIPILFKFRTTGQIARFYFLVGPQLGYLISAKQSYYKQDQDYNEYTYNPNTNKPIKVSESTITSRFNSIDVFARIDFGADISLMPNLILNAGFSFAYGLLDVNASDYHIKNADGNYNASHNAYGGFNVGLVYCFTKK